MIGAAFLAKAALSVGIPKRFHKLAGYGVIALLIGLAVWRVIAWDNGRIAAAEKRGATAENARLAEKARKIKLKTDALTGAITVTLKEKNSAENRRVAGVADGLRLSGAGKAAARICPSVAGGSGGHGSAGASSHAPGASLPADNGNAVVPWGWLVGSAERCDILRNEVLTWREWHRQIGAGWPASKQ